MIQEYNMDISDESFWHIASHAMEVTSSQLPLLVEEVGMFAAGSSYYTLRKNKPVFLLIHTVGGEGELLYARESYRLKPDTVALIDCMQEHAYHTSANCRDSWRFYWLHLTGSCTPFFYRSLHRDGFDVLRCGQIPLQYFHKILSLYDSQQLADICSCSSSAYSLLTELLQFHNTSDQLQIQPHFEDIERVKRYIRERYAQPLRLADMAAKANLSKYHFLRLFKAYTEVTPYQYLQQYRINESKKLLRATDFTLAGISQRVGFSDEFQFSKAFRQITGQTPGAYRRAY